MSGPRPELARALPTLTEVVDVEVAPSPTAEPTAAVVFDDAIAVEAPWLDTEAVLPPSLGEPAPATTGSAAPASAAAEPAAAVIDEAALTQRVLVEVQRQIDLMFEYRVRETLGPLLARVADSLVREAGAELASTLRDVVARAVAQEMARQRGR